MAQEEVYTKKSGKFNHLHGDLAKPEEQFLDVRKPFASGEGTFVKASGKYLAFAANEGRKVHVKKLTDYGRIPSNEPTIANDFLKGRIFDWDFSPFIDTMIALASESGRIGVVNIPQDGLTSNITEATVDLGVAHTKKVTLVEFNPSANSILASGSFDRTVKVWNIESGEEVAAYNGCGDNIFSVKWNADGSQLAVTSKDKQLHIFDPRQTDAAQTTAAFDGAKASKCFWVPRLNWIGSTGFNKGAKRQLKLWDLRSLDKPIYANVIDQASAILMPHFDDDNGVLYMAGKGEGTVTWSELVNDGRKVYNLGQYRTAEPQKGGGWVPKRALDVFKCEVQRFLKLTKDSIRPVSMIVPRKAGADIFQEDIYPDCASNRPATTADEWIGGTNNPINRMKMDPKDRPADDGSATTFVAKKTYAELEAENQQLRARVAELEQQLGIEPTTTNDDDAKEADPADTMASAADADYTAPADAEAAADE